MPLFEKKLKRLPSATLQKLLWSAKTRSLRREGIQLVLSLNFIRQKSMGGGYNFHSTSRAYRPSGRPDRALLLGAHYRQAGLILKSKSLPKSLDKLIPYPLILSVTAYEYHEMPVCKDLRLDTCRILKCPRPTLAHFDYRRCIGCVQSVEDRGVAALGTLRKPYLHIFYESKLVGHLAAAAVKRDYFARRLSARKRLERYHFAAKARHCTHKTPVNVGKLRTAAGRAKHGYHCQKYKKRDISS